MSTKYKRGCYLADALLSVEGINARSYAFTKPGKNQMGWLIFNICLAVTLAIVMVWWTLPSSKKKKPKPKPPSEHLPPPP